MSNAKTRFWVDIVALISFVVVAISGFVLWLGLPKGLGRGRDVSQEFFLDISRDLWLDVHDWFSIILVVAMAIHLYFNWSWLARMSRDVLR